MADPETRSLRLGAAVLIVLSLLRWASDRTSVPLVSASPEVAEAHARATRAAADDGARRARPLGPGERIDPNRAPAVELDRLPGIGPATARAIVAARDSGLVFRRPDDLKVVKGVGPTLAERVASHLDLADPPPASRPIRTRRALAAPVDVNRADEQRLTDLPGIGPVIARRIVHARAERPFASLDELTRVPGIGAATVARLAGSAIAGAGAR